jgi:hypothetical protein
MEPNYQLLMNDKRKTETSASRVQTRLRELFNL